MCRIRKTSRKELSRRWSRVVLLLPALVSTMLIQTCFGQNPVARLRGNPRPIHHDTGPEQSREIAKRLARLPPVLQASSTTRIRACLAEEMEELPAPSPGHTIPLSGQPGSEAVEVENRDGMLSLVVRDAPLDQVLSTLAQTQGLNIVCAEDINARISVTLSNVTLDDALNAMLSVAGYTWTRKSDIIHVTSISNAASLPPEVQGRFLEVFPLDYASAADASEAIKGMLSPAGKSYVVQSAPTDNRKTRNMVFVEDVPGYLTRIARYVAEIDRPPRQVLIEAHVLQVDLQDDKRHGVDFEHLFSLASNGITVQTTGLANPLAPQALFATVGGGNLEALVECLKTTTDAKTLASPKVLVVNGQEARIQIGEQLGFRVTTTTETSTLENVDFLDVGVVLRVTPHISRDNHVLMRVKPEVSSGAINPETGLPEEETTEVETDVLLQSGQGMVIGGLIQEKDSNIQSKIPFLGDLWLVGVLFQRRHIEKTRAEIIVTLLPRVVPYDPVYEAHSYCESHRCQTPLLYGALERYPRPWEPSLPDAIRNPVVVRLPPVQTYWPFHRGQSPILNESQPAEGVPQPQPVQDDDRIGVGLAPYGFQRR